MALAYHGKYCGPGWSAGRYQGSVVSNVLPVDEFDASCRAHDADYATPGTDLATADLRFAAENIQSLNPKRLAAGVAVGAQGALRLMGVLGRDNVTNPGTLSTTRKIRSGGSTSLLPWQAYQASPQGKQSEAMGRKNRVNAAIARNGALGAAILSKIQPLSKKTASAQRGMLRKAGNRIAASNGTVTSAPVAIGTSLRSQVGQVTALANGVVVRGRDIVSTVKQTSSVEWQLAALCPIHPAYYIGTALSNFVRTYAKFKFRRLAVHFITKMPTSVTGEVLVSHRRNAVEPSEDGNSAQFVSRAMSRPDSTIGPIWTNHSVEINVDDQYRLVDCFVTDWADNVLGDVEVYVNSNSASDAGYLMFEYECEFREAMYSPHQTTIPLGLGASQNLTIAIQGYTPGTTITSYDARMIINGGDQPDDRYRMSVWKVTLDLDLSTIGAWKPAFTMPVMTPGSTTISYSATTSTLSFRDGTTFWAVCGSQAGSAGSQYIPVTLYATYDQAVADSFAGVLVNSSTTAVTLTTLVGLGYQTRLPPTEIVSAA